MIGGVILASYGFYGGTIGNLLNAWAEAGFFDYLLPFLLLFAVIFGILSSTQIFKDNRMVDGIIAFAVALMALQFDFVPVFFSQLFPRVGIALSIILTLLILAGFFIDPRRGAIMYGLLGVGVVTAIVVFVNTSNAVGWEQGYWWSDNWPLIAGVVFILIAVALIIGGTQKPHDYGAYQLGPFRVPGPGKP
jgi:hypothetical protein